MQKLYLKGKTSIDYLKQENDKILHFSLQDTLPAGHSLALNITLGTLSYMTCKGGIPRLIMQEQFTSTEMTVLLPLFEMFPYYCPYEMMYASFYNGNIAEETVTNCRKHLQGALEAGIWDQEMRPVRGALSRARLKLRPFGFDISSILATGYILIAGSQTISSASA